MPIPLRVLTRASVLMAVAGLIGCDRGALPTTPPAGTRPSPSLGIGQDEMNVRLSHGPRHTLELRGGHVWLDGRDYGGSTARGREDLFARFNGRDAFIDSVRRMTLTISKHIRHRALRSDVGAAIMPSVAEHVGGPIFAANRTAGEVGMYASAITPVPTIGVFAAAREITMDVAGADGSYCSLSIANEIQCYDFLISFQNDQNLYISVRLRLEDGFMEWVNNAGQSIFIQYMNALADGTAAAAEAMAESWDYYNEYVDIADGFALASLSSSLNTDVWIYNTWGAGSSDWMLDCSDPNVADLDPTDCGPSEAV